MFALVRQEQHSLRCGWTFGTLVSFGLSVTILFLLAFMAQQWFAYPLVASTATCSNTYTEDSIHCGTNNTCLVGLLSATGDSCIQRPRPLTRACTSNCYVTDSTSTFCDANGTCVGNTTECKGQCVAGECSNFYVMNSALIAALDTDGWQYVWDNTSGCFFGMCYASVLDIYASTIRQTHAANASQPYALTARSARNRCSDYIDPTYAAANDGCIQTARYVIDTNLTKYSMFGNQGNASVPFQLSLCIFTYACAEIDPTLLTKKRGLSSEAPGAFHAIEGAEMNILKRSSDVRNAFWEEMHTKTVATLARTPEHVKRALMQGR